MSKTAIVAICTAKRPQMLAACVRSIQTQVVPSGWHVDILVVENDTVPHHESLVQELANQGGLSVRYIHEPALGIPYARNAAIEEALRAKAEWLIFIDDDETATFTWLSRLLEAAERMVADAFQGPVHYIYPDNAPQWLEKKSRRVLATGTPMDTAATNNVMFNLRLCQPEPEGLGLRFDTRMQFTGGSDTDFFYRATDKGALILWVNDAEVIEIVIADRLTLAAVLKRTYRVAANASLVHRRRKGYLKTLRRYGIRALVRYVGGILHITRGLVVWHLQRDKNSGQQKAFYGIKHLVAASGFLTGLTNWQPKPYKAIDGH